MSGKYPASSNPGRFVSAKVNGRFNESESPVPDARLLEIYNALRPYRSTKAELYAIGDELINEYGATVSGNFVKEAADIYEKRNRLKK